MSNKPKRVKCKLIFSCIGIVSGASVFVSFLALHNVHAAVWGLISAIFAAINLRMHILYRKNLLHLRFTQQSLATVKWCGLVSSIASFIAAITYFTLAAVLKQGYKTKDDGYAPAGVFALFLALKWALMMYFSGRTYENFITEYSLIEEGCVTNEDPPPPYNAY